MAHANLEPLVELVRHEALILGHFKPDPDIPWSIRPSQNLYESFKDACSYDQ